MMKRAELPTAGARTITLVGSKFVRGFQNASRIASADATAIRFAHETRTLYWGGEPPQSPPKKTYGGETPPPPTAAPPPIGRRIVL